MSKLIVREIAGKDGQPVAFPNGIKIGSAQAGTVNNIGLAGQQGFGVGICPGPLPAGFGGLFGYQDPASDNYGNYQYSDGSVMVWIPAFYYKYGTGANGNAINIVTIKAFSEYADVATANAAGYALHRAFYDGGAVQPGFFRDKYAASNNGGIASSLRNGIPLSSAIRGGIANTAFASLAGAPSNTHGGAIAVCKTRGANFFVTPRFMSAAIALLALAHAQASSNTTYCAWYHATNNFPKGCNNNALGDAQDAAILYVADGSATGCAKTGSANLFARTTHNGQNSGICDDNGNIYGVTPGITSDATSYYLLKTSVAMKNVTGGNTLATDLWGATGLAAQYDNIGATYGALWATGANRLTTFGSATQVLSESVSGTPWNAAGMGIPLVGGVGGSNAFGNDQLYDYNPNEMFPLSGGNWGDASAAGLWMLHLYHVRGNAHSSVGCRAACYL
ncbi:hypothetical protein [Propionivibrio sp.]|uniref:hypothetical protein n=1 Tax=Propionivibrio sp. TaxID=2212460 RepID=UPI003BF3FFD7